MAVLSTSITPGPDRGLRVFTLEEEQPKQGQKKSSPSHSNDNLDEKIDNLREKLIKLGSSRETLDIASPESHLSPITEMVKIQAEIKELTTLKAKQEHDQMRDILDGKNIGTPSEQMIHQAKKNSSDNLCVRMAEKMREIIATSNELEITEIKLEQANKALVKQAEICAQHAEQIASQEKELIQTKQERDVAKAALLQAQKINKDKSRGCCHTLC